jgi:hypothetical protein
MMTVIAQILLYASMAMATPQNFGPITINIPDGWSCKPDDHNYVCLEQKEGPESTAVVVSYKDKGPDDKLDIYKSQLGQPRVLKDGEVNQLSEVREVREIELNGIKWIEGIHLGSEITDYYTHYFVTTVDPYAVLISISVHKSAYPADFAKLKPMIDSFVVTAPKALPPAAFAPTNSPPPALDSAINLEDEKPKTNQKFITIGGYKIPRGFALIGGIFVLVVLLLGYAILA